MSNKKWKMGQIFVVFSEYLDFNFGRRYEKSHYAFLISAQSGALDWMFDLKIKSWKEFRKLTFLLFFCTHIFFFSFFQWLWQITQVTSPSYKFIGYYKEPTSSLIMTLSLHKVSTSPRHLVSLLKNLEKYLNFGSSSIWMCKILDFE